MSDLKRIHAREIFDSRDNPTVEVDLTTGKGTFRASVPSGASLSIFEAVELRDKDARRYNGKGVLNAVENVNTIIGPALIARNVDVTQQRDVDTLMLEMDGTENKTKLGANAILSVSLAACKAGAAQKCVLLYRHIADLAGNSDALLPCPAFNLINGGTHTGNKLAMEDLMILPTSAGSFREAVQIGSEVYHSLKLVIKGKYGQDAANVCDMGGFSPNIQSHWEGLELLELAIEEAGYEGRVHIGMDVAAFKFHKVGKYDLDFKNPESKSSNWFSGSQLTEIYQSLIDKFPIISIEDCFDQEDWQAWTEFTAKTKIQIVGDNFLVTSPKRIKKAIEQKACNALLLKVNQIGSVTESIEACKLSQAGGWGAKLAFSPSSSSILSS